MKQDLDWVKINEENIISVGVRGYWYNIIIFKGALLEVKRRIGDIDFCEESLKFETPIRAKRYAQLHFNNCLPV